MQESFLSPSIEGDKSQKKFFFENRKAGINALMDLIGEYIDQIPEWSHSSLLQEVKNFISVMSPTFTKDPIEPIKNPVRRQRNM